MSSTDTANADQITCWNEQVGPKWVTFSDLLNDQIAPLGQEAMERARLARGERVLDVGCGCGQTSIELASRVGESGRVLGIDISGPMLENARERAAVTPGTLEFLQADAQTHDFEPASFDRVFSRFGVMFFDDPVAAFANLRRATAPGGGLNFVCWQTIAKNPWMLLPAAAAAQHVKMPEPAGPDAPGPFAFADDGRVRSILDGAGWTEIDCATHEGILTVGRGMALDEIVAFLQQMGPAGAALREASDAARAAATRSMIEALEPHYEGDALSMEFATWIVTATAP